MVTEELSVREGRRDPKDLVKVNIRQQVPGPGLKCVLFM